MGDFILFASDNITLYQAQVIQAREFFLTSGLLLMLQVTTGVWYLLYWFAVK